MTITSEEEFEKIKEVGQICGKVLQEMGKLIEPGMNTLELDQIGGKLLEQYGAISAPQFMYKFPGFTCISINHEVAHGIPSESAILQPGDMVNIDVSATKYSLFADTGASFIVPPASKRDQHLCRSTKKALFKAIERIAPGQPLSVVGKAVESVARKEKLSIIENLCGHGVGKKLHEAPKFILNYYDSAEKRQFHEGQVVAIEPFLSTGAHQVNDKGDGWTLLTDPKFRTAQFEHTLVITKRATIPITKID